MEHHSVTIETVKTSDQSVARDETDVDSVTMGTDETDAQYITIATDEFEGNQKVAVLD